MDSIMIIFLLAVSALCLVYLAYGKYVKEKKGKDPVNYIDGLKALLDGNEEEAFSRLRDVVAEDAENIDAYIRIGDILRNYGKFDKALQVHKDLTLRHNLSGAEKKMILKALVRDFFKLEDYDSAIAALKELVSLGNKDRWVQEKLLEINTVKGNWDAAFEARETIIKLDGSKSKKPLAIYKYFHGEKLVQEKEFHKARHIFKEAIHLDEKCTPAYLAIGDSYIAEDRVDDAIAIWQKMIIQIPGEVHLVLGRLKKALFELGRYGEIAGICEDILNVDSKNLMARLTLADYYQKKGDLAMGSEHLSTAVDNFPQSNLPIIKLAKIQLKNKDYKKLGDLLNKLEEQYEIAEGNYFCTSCGYENKTKLWLCPACKAVDSFEL